MYHSLQILNFEKKTFNRFLPRTKFTNAKREEGNKNCPLYSSSLLFYTPLTFQFTKIIYIL